MSSTFHVRKILVAVFILVVIGVGGVAVYFTYPKTAGSYIVTPVSSATTMSSTPTSIIPSSKTNTTTIPIQWITVAQPKSVDYYLSLLESNGTAPYVQLASELRKLPDLTNATAVATITYLALNATNPEVKQALELMMNDGTPAPGNFTYSVPTYNTDLEVLYWLAAQNRLKKDDTLTLAIAMTNGLWITMGDNAVITDVHTQASERLILGREINEFQAAKNLDYSLEKSSLLGKILWSWNANENGVFGIKLMDYYFKGLKFTDSIYKSSTISPDQLAMMRNFILQKGLVAATADETISNLEEYLWFDSSGDTTFPHWVYTDQHLQDPGYQLNLLLTTGNGTGSCNSEYVVVDSMAKSIGIPTTAIFRNLYDNNGKFVMGHMHAVYYDSQTNSWKAYPYQLVEEGRPLNEMVRLFIMKPPVDYSSWFWEKHDNIDTVMSGHHYIMASISRSDIVQMFENGVPDSEIENYLLYA